jgi:hypothetical protein
VVGRGPGGGRKGRAAQPMNSLAESQPGYLRAVKRPDSIPRGDREASWSSVSGRRPRWVSDGDSSGRHGRRTLERRMSASMVLRGPDIFSREHLAEERAPPDRAAPKNGCLSREKSDSRPEVRARRAVLSSPDLQSRSQMSF